MSEQYDCTSENRKGGDEERAPRESSSRHRHDLPVSVAEDEATQTTADGGRRTDEHLSLDNAAMGCLQNDQVAEGLDGGDDAKSAPNATVPDGAETLARSDGTVLFSGLQDAKRNMEETEAGSSDFETSTSSEGFSYDSENDFYFDDEDDRDAADAWPHRWTWEGLAWAYRDQETAETKLERATRAVARMLFRRRLMKPSERSQIARKMESLISTFPEICSEPDSNGVMILQQALEDNVSLEVVQVIANAYPAAVTFAFPNSYGENDLTSVIRDRSRHDDIFAFLVDTAMSYLQLTTPNGPEEVEEFFSHHCDMEDIVNRMLQEFPFLKEQIVDLMRCLESGNMLSLHFAVMHGAPVKVLKEIIACCPQLRELPGYDGETPLHIACRSDSNPEVMQLLASAEAVRTFDFYGNLPLHTYLKNSSRITFAIIQSLLSCSEKQIILACDRNGSTAFHMLVSKTSRRHENFNIIRYMVQVCPSCLLQLDSSGRMPIHLLCNRMNEDDFQILEFLGTSCPATLQVQDDRGLTPLHCFCEGVIEDSEDMVMLRFLVSACPECIEQKDYAGNTPIHLLCHRAERKDLSPFCLLARLCPAALRVTNNDGAFPLHIACSRSTSDNEVIRSMAQLCPEILSLPGGRHSKSPLSMACDLSGIPHCDSFDCDGVYGCRECLSIFRDRLRILAPSKQCVMAARSSLEGTTALHKLASEGAPEGVLQVLIEKYPQAAKIKDKYDRIPLHSAINCAGYQVANGDKVSYEGTVKCLLQAFPLGIKSMDVTGKTPLVCACEADASLDMIYELFSVDPITSMEICRGSPSRPQHGKKRKRSLS